MRSSQCDEVSVSVLLPLDYTQQMQVYQKVPESEKRKAHSAGSRWEQFPHWIYISRREIPVHCILLFLRWPTVFTLSLSVSKDGVQIFALNNGTAGPCVSQYTRSRQRVNCLLFCNTLTCTVFIHFHAGKVCIVCKNFNNSLELHVCVYEYITDFSC